VCQPNCWRACSGGCAGIIGGLLIRDQTCSATFLVARSMPTPQRYGVLVKTSGCCSLIVRGGSADPLSSLRRWICCASGCFMPPDAPVLEHERCGGAQSRGAVHNSGRNDALWRSCISIAAIAAIRCQVVGTATPSMCAGSAERPDTSSSTRSGARICASIRATTAWPQFVISGPAERSRAAISGFHLPRRAA
jgi:hypothetical protein